MKLSLGDVVGYQGIDYRVEAILAYALTDRVLYLARMVGPGQVRFVEPTTSDAADRVLVLAEIDSLDITTPPPATIYHHGESYLLEVAGTAEVRVTDKSPSPVPGTCTLWRYRAAGGQFLQIEKWPDRVCMLCGASVHTNMLEIRPATIENDTA